MSRPFTSPREAALAVLNSDFRPDLKSCGFLVQLIANDPPRLSYKQAGWMADLHDKAGLARPRLRVRR